MNLFISRFSPTVRLSEWRRGIPQRQGLSMLEVLIAITVLGLSLTAIGGLFKIGLKGASQADLRGQAQILCDSVMAEVAAGVLELNSVSDNAFDDETDWVFSIAVSNSDYIGLVSVTVTVRQADVEDPFEYSLFRFMPDPNYELPSAPEQIEN